MTVCFSEDVVRMQKAGNSPPFVPVSTTLYTTATGMSSNTFEAFTGTIPDRVTYQGSSVNVFEDGKTTGGAQCFGYSGKGCYDWRRQRAMWMAAGASLGVNNADSGAYVYNNLMIFVESTNTWTATRGFRAANEDTTAANVSHQYDSNCIDVDRGKLYKWHGFGGGIMVYDLDQGTMGNLIDGPNGTEEESTAVWGMEFIPTRGERGALWLLAYENASTENLGIWEYTLHNATWTQILTNTQIEALGSVWTNGDAEYEPLISYNPRAFGNAGAVMICGGVGIRIIRCDTLAISNPGLGAAGTPRFNGFCRDPVGDGWIHMYQGTDRVWRYSSSGGWENRRAMDGAASPYITSGDFMVIPIDQYGVIWAMAYNDGTPVGVLYKP